MAPPVPRRRQFCAAFNGVASLLFLLLMFTGSDWRGSPSQRSRLGLSSFLSSRSVIKVRSSQISSRSDQLGVNSLRWRPYRHLTELNSTVHSNSSVLYDPEYLAAVECAGVFDHTGFENECDFLKAHVEECGSKGFFDYLMFFYCSCGNFRILGYAVLGIWLVALFYMLGNTAADYFCCSLEKMSELLNLPPTVAGVTLLPLGNGAPDVFASIAAFMGTGAGGVGINSVLGGAVFVTCVVSGAVMLCIAEKNVQIDRRCFVRDIVFFLLALFALSVILFMGRVTVLGAVLFVSIYALYVFTVAANELLRKHAKRLNLDAVMPLLPVKGSIFLSGVEEDESVYSMLLEDDANSDVAQANASLPQWMWASNVAIYSNLALHANTAENSRPLWGWSDEGERETKVAWLTFSKLFLFMEFPLTLPRRLTIPIIEEDRWSRGFAVASAGLSPLLVAFLWNNQGGMGLKATIASYVACGSLGITLATLAYMNTTSDQPPKRLLFPWVFGGFVMSIVWFYIIANELVALLVSFGDIMGINPSILGLTVLAWGNSMGDLTSDIALALNGGDGAQIAMSGCYAGPMFNMLAGLGISMSLGAFSVAPDAYALPQDSSLVYTMSFLVTGLVLALVVLLRNDMRPNKLLGISLITLYVAFLLIRVISAAGMLPLASFS